MKDKMGSYEQQVDSYVPNKEGLTEAEKREEAIRDLVWEIYKDGVYCGDLDLPYKQDSAEIKDWAERVKDLFK